MQMHSFQPTDLEYFIEICRLGSISQAAIHLGVSQPALSKAIRRLEQIAGARLLDRTARGISPTEMGCILVQRASLILHELDATRSVLQEMSGVRTGSVSMGVPPTLNHGFIPDVVELAVQQRPKLHFRVSEGLFQSLLPQLQLGKLDFIISSPTSLEALATDLQCEPLGSNLFVACVGANHPLTQLNNISDESLQQYGWVLVPPPGVLRDQLDHLFRQRGLQPLEPQVETSSTMLSKALITRQNLIGFLPLEVFAAEEQAGIIQRLDVPWLHWRRELALVLRRSRALTPAAEYMVNLIRHQAAARLERPAQPH
ncbi:LysR family transcriptional regulator [Pusillimonas sp. CC-YST705]|uniref:LysR family transcriptional regulator n=1 Tax=Mesopusillimonas faecipullorum TaxID=2755040 RepID=A0ABS8CE42_9BURK|nr:LysR family transcriptional regulator [Mesopusillimonas faecipullorum]MCB5364283.1 LysR family transcriptional regulator [Mesopusillimonas faecipullorum]